MPLTSKDKSAIWLAKIKNDPVLHQEYLEKELQRRKDRKLAGTLKSFNELSERHKRAVSKKWRMQQKLCPDKKKEQENNMEVISERSSEFSISRLLITPTGLQAAVSLISLTAKARGRRKVIGSKAKVYRENEKLKLQLKEMCSQRNK